MLCGSEKYPVKDPFVQLAKGSFATFLNAFTSPDCTCYPVCSRSQQELLNLMDVYMDAVLHPLSVKSPLAFKQEGWHYELDGPDGELKRNGIVYSEMKGGFSNPERRLYTEVSRLLFPDTTYGFVSGGDPAAIPTLTFEMYKDFYNRFYHPSNARIFLDGTMDVKAVLAKLPRLSLCDIPEKGTYIPREIVKAGGVTVVRPHTHANGILHAECHFSAEDFTAEELADLPFLAHLFTNLRTSRRSLDDLRNFRDGRLGRFYSSVGVYSSPKDGEGRPYFTVRVSSLESRADDALSFTSEVLRETQFDDIKAIGKLLRQDRLDAEQMPNGISGSHFAKSRATAQLTSRGAMDEIVGGIAHIRHLQKADDDFAEHGADYAKRLAGLAAKLFTRDRLVVCLPDNIPLSWAERIAEAFPRGKIGPRQEIKPFPRKKEGFRTLGTISGTAMVAHPVKNPYSGKAIIAARALSYGYLWEEIRVKGGAYGGNFGIGRSGDASWSSWNDPKPARTLDLYAGCGKALRAFADGEDSLDSQIVSAVAKSEPYQTPSAETYSASSLWLSGRTPDDLQRTRSEMLKTTKQDLRAFADEIDAMTSSTAICVVGGAQLVDSCTNLLDHVETLAR